MQAGNWYQAPTEQVFPRAGALMILCTNAAHRITQKLSNVHIADRRRRARYVSTLQVHAVEPAAAPAHISSSCSRATILSSFSSSRTLFRTRQRCKSVEQTSPTFLQAASPSAVGTREQT